jgi:hypothetical protein
MGRAREKIIMDNENNVELNEAVEAENTTPSTSEEISKMVEARVMEELAGIKEKLNSAYSARDEAVKKAVAYEEEKKHLEIKRLEEEGKHKEAADIKLTELSARLQEREKQITELTRDSVVREALRGLDFRNDTAADFAYRDVVSQLTQDENGQWVHRTGASIKDFVDSFRKDDDKEFLFRPKQSAGVGSAPAAMSSTGGFDATKPLSEMTTDEIMAAAAAGHLGSNEKWI